MGVPVTTNVYEELSQLSFEDKAKVIAWLAESMLPQKSEDEQLAAKGSKEVLGEIRPPKKLSAVERASRLEQLSGAWSGSESAEQLVKDVYSSRTTEDRNYLFDE